MGSSAKKKSARQKDFKKAKLKVGQKAKPTNATNTTFTAKAIVLKQQSLHAEAPSTTSLFTHHLCLVSSKQDSQRREALAALTNHLAAHGFFRLPVATVTIIAKVRPCLIDPSRSIRAQALKLLASLDPAEIAHNVNPILIYVHIGMVHLAADIRSSSLDVLEWLIRDTPNETVSCPGGWVHTLTSLVTLLKWSKPDVQDAAGWSTSGSVNHRMGSDGKLKARQLAVLALLLNAGLCAFSSSTTTTDAQTTAVRSFPIWHADRHDIGTRPDAFAHLNLFGTVVDETNMMFDDVASRSSFYRDRLHASVLRGLSEAQKEGGEVGRAASQLDKVLRSFALSDSTDSA